MARPKFDVSQVREVLDTICATMGDHTDKNPSGGLNPRYLDQGQPACLVGMILAHLGFSPGVLRELDKEHAALPYSSHPILKRFSPDARALLEFLQSRNDGQWTWGRARREAFRVRNYWRTLNPRFALPGPWCTFENEIKDGDE